MSDDVRPQRSRERGEEVEEEAQEEVVVMEGRAGREQLHFDRGTNDDDDAAASSSLVPNLLQLEALPPAPSGSQGPQRPTNPDSELTSPGKTH